jgi:hypothetical protein
VTDKKKFRSYPAPILEAWATWESLRKLGFSSDNIFWVFENTLNAIPRPGLTLGIKLAAQGKELRVTCSERLTEGEARRLEREAAKFMAAVNADSFDHEEMKQVLFQSFVWKNQLQFVMALKGKGFEFPFKLN